MFRKLTTIGLFFLLVVVSAQAQTNVQKFLLTFIPNVQFSPVYVSIAQGYFADIGLEIQLEYLNEPDVLDLVAAGQEQFGMVSGEQVILAASRGRPITYVYEWFQQYPVGIVVVSDSGYETVDDLQGLRVGIPGRFGASYSGLLTLLGAYGLSESDIQLEEIGFNAPEVFCLGALDATVVYINNEPIQINNRAALGECDGIESVDVIPVSSVADLVSNGIITNRELVEQSPEYVAQFVAAFDAGLRYTIQNPARAYLDSAEFVENLPLDDEFRAILEVMADEQDQFLASNPDTDAIADSRQQMYEELHSRFDGELLLQFDVLMASILLWDAEQPGFSELESWEAMQAILLEQGAITSTIEDLSVLFTNKFLPGN